MGLGNNNGFVSPRDAALPMGTPAELGAAGYSLSECHSCAIPAPGIKGCMYAEKCSRLFGKKGQRFGGFGPPSTAPGTPGQGYENVAYSLETIEGDYKEDYTYCHMFMATLYNRMLASRDPEFPSAERIHLLGKAGETDIIVWETLPQAPKLSNTNRNYTMVTTEKIVPVPRVQRLAEIDQRARSRRAATLADNEDYLAGFAGESRAPAGASPADSEPASAEAEEAPIPRRRGPKREAE